MAFALNIADFDALPAADQVRVVTQLWERVAAHPERLPVSEPQRQELRGRLAAHDADPSTALPWEALEEELLGQS